MAIALTVQKRDLERWKGTAFEEGWTAVPNSRHRNPVRAPFGREFKNMDDFRACLAAIGAKVKGFKVIHNEQMIGKFGDKFGLD